jgi:8-oxo-dGTP pyrophosphatase MutT (NUDIX family)
MTKQHVRAIAIAVIERDDRLFVFEAFDPVTGEPFYRPLGGGIEYGELGIDCIRREFREEIGAELEGMTYLGTIENCFIYDGALGHEIVLVYRARFADPDRYLDRSVEVFEEGEILTAHWVDQSEFRSGSAHLVPDGLLALLESRAELGGHVATTVEEIDE